MPEDTVALARSLIGALLVREREGRRSIVRIIEDEAYPLADPASHAFRGRTPRNGAMFLARGHAYVYYIYGMHWCLNVASEIAGAGAAVLIRAAEAVAGFDELDRNALRGPGRLAATLGIDRTLDGADLCVPGPLWLATDGSPQPAIGASARIGLTRAAEVPLRFYARGHTGLSGPKRLSPSEGA